MDKKPQLIDFLHSHNVTTIATVSAESMPHATTIYYYLDEDLNFYFVTKNQTIKFKNIQSNNNVGLVITDIDKLQTVQVEGVSRQITSVSELSTYIDKLAKSVLGHKGIEELPVSKIKNGEICFFKITPTWIKWVNFKETESIEFEESFNVNK